MSRLWATNDDLTAWVEIQTFDDTDGIGEAYELNLAHCVGCDVNLSETEGGLISRTNAVHVAQTHADACVRCADGACVTPRPHDAGHQCRKP